ncbi:MAG: HPr kinase/phosphorylase, partial [Myxococcales bacterium]|nr:HPr kinase/phosphorylase [Myxococcales bacterium]
MKVSELLDPDHELDLTLAAGESGVKGSIDSHQVQKSGLAMTGYTKYIYPGWIQILGNSEVSYLNTLPEERRREILVALCEVDV